MPFDTSIFFIIVLLAVYIMQWISIMVRERLKIARHSFGNVACLKPKYTCESDSRNLTWLCVGDVAFPLLQALAAVMGVKSTSKLGSWRNLLMDAITKSWPLGLFFVKLPVMNTISKQTVSMWTCFPVFLIFFISC
jgi:hypothetical protein